MKKTLLLSVAASAMIMAGGDIAPVEPAVAAPAPSGWDFSGQAVFYYNTMSMYTIDLFDQELAAANAGIQLRAVNNDVFAGIGAGFELNGLATLDLEKDMVGTPMQVPSGSWTDKDLTGGWISQAYLTYGFGNTSIKLGRQELPQALSPFAYSEDWNVFKNTYDALVVVNTDLPNTTLVGAYVKRANFNMYGFFPALIPPMPSMNDFIALGDNGVYMLTAQNKSIDNVTLTGSYYMANDFAAVYDLDIMWADAQIGLDGINIGLQGGKVSLDAPGFADTKAYGAKIEGKVSGFDLGFAYSHINDSDLGMFNVGGTTSALYTETLLDQTMPSAALLFIPNLFRNANDKYMLKASTELWGGKITGSFTMTDHDYAGDISEIDLCYTTKLTDNVDLKAAFAHGSFDTPLDDIDMLRVVARYNF